MQLTPGDALRNLARGHSTCCLLAHQCLSTVLQQNFQSQNVSSLCTCVPLCFPSPLPHTTSHSLVAYNETDVENLRAICLQWQERFLSHVLEQPYAHFLASPDPQRLYERPLSKLSK